MLIQALGSSELTEKEVVSHRNTCVALSSGPKYHSGIVIKPTSQMAFSQIHDCNCSIQIQSSTTALVCVRNGKKRNDRFIRLIKQSRRGEMTVAVSILHSWQFVSTTCKSHFTLWINNQTAHVPKWCLNVSVE